MKESTGKLLNKNISEKIIKGAKETNERRQQIKELQKKSAKNKIVKALNNNIATLRNNVAQRKLNRTGKSEPIPSNIADFLEESDSETEEETKKEEAKPEGKKKKQTKDKKEGNYKNLSSSFTSDMLKEGIARVDKELKDFSTENKRNVLVKEGSDDLNTKLNKYGLKFKTGTSVATVIKRLQEHKTRLENHFGTGEMNPKQEGKVKKAESI